MDTKPDSFLTVRETPPPPFLKKIREKDVYLYHGRGLSLNKKPRKNNKLLAVQFETGVFFSILVPYSHFS